MEPQREAWPELFGAAAPGVPSAAIALRVLKKHGRRFLFLPLRARSAIATLSLYPAQTSHARLAKAAWRLLLRCPWPVGSERLALSLASATPFAEFLRRQASVPPGGLPEFGVLAGNPAGNSQRFLFMLFDAAGRPVAVVKAGRSAGARALVRKEAAFLAATSGHQGIPRLRGAAEGAEWQALALDYVAGTSPRPEQAGEVAGVLGNWVDAERRVPLGNAPEWQRLVALPAVEPLRLEPLSGREVCATLQHGDFAPWNIKVDATGAWQVLDWERGEVVGIPGWDWFHYVIQTAILVERLPVPELAARVEALLAGDAFRQYAARARITGLERQLVLAYLAHCIEIIRPAEGLEAARGLVADLKRRWP